MASSCSRVASLCFVAKRTPRASTLRRFSPAGSLAASAVVFGTACVTVGAVLGGEGRLFFLLGLAICWSRRLWPPLGALLFVVALSWSSNTRGSISWWAPARGLRRTVGHPVRFHPGNTDGDRSKKRRRYWDWRRWHCADRARLRTYDLTSATPSPWERIGFGTSSTRAGGSTAMLAIITLQTQGAPNRARK